MLALRKNKKQGLQRWTSILPQSRFWHSRSYFYDKNISDKSHWRKGSSALNTALYLLQQTAIMFLDALQIAFLLRMIISLFDPTGEGFLGSLLFVITEPFVMPLRLLFEKLHWFENSPLDFAFFFTALLVGMLQTVFVLAI